MFEQSVITTSIYHGLAISMKEIVDKVLASTVKRRTFMKWGTAAGGAAVVAAHTLPVKASATEAKPAVEEIKSVWSACTVNCGSRCALRHQVKDGVIIHTETDNTGDDTYGNHQVRACLRGRSFRKRVYNPDRLKYPMKRVGKRGEGRFERISWDEAFDTIADNLKRIKKEYGNEAIYLNYCTGTLGGTVSKSWPPAATPIARLMNCWGGYLNHYGDYSTAQIAVSLPYLYGGSWVDNNCTSDVVNTRLVVNFGNNPAETRMSGAGIVYQLSEARQRSNARMITFDPRMTDTVLGANDEWVPLRPGTDAALVAGMAWVMITEDLVDNEFLGKYTIGYDENSLPASAPKGASWKSYILGKGDDGVAKTPQWAAKITGVPADTIIRLAREIAMTKPCNIMQGWGLQRTANGEQASRAICMLAVMTGNVGIPGGGTGAREGSYSMPFAVFPTLTNPVSTSIPMFLWTDAIYRHDEMTALTAGIRGAEKLTQPIKFIWNYAGNCIINQHADTNRTHDILQDDSQCEMIVVIDNHMTPSARYADILLPDLTAAEQPDFAPNGYCGNMGYTIFCDTAVEPLYECRSVYDMCTGIAKRLGVEAQFTEGRDQEAWLRHIYAESQRMNPTLVDLDFATFREQGIVKQKNPGEPHVQFREFRESPEKHPLDTPSGKIEIYSERLANIASSWTLAESDTIRALPEYVSSWEGHEADHAQQYPLQMFGFHFKARTHSTYGNVDVLRETNRQEVWINPVDAHKRKIKDGDMLKVWNDRGEIRVAAKVTERIMPGVVAMGQGSWYAPDRSGVDRGACMNTLTTQRPSPLAKGNPQHSNLVNIARA
ncbi:DMSO/selenate family reductase complex A subunit [Endozoicomonas acroporae]|uniref:DMSO/selenate family reductase complex A subunit n=1 Tax=Endozoicomonas acroporae TaxID=1701104 RepID=UPI003D7AE870